MSECMVTTIDNKWNPFTQQREWLRHDIDHGYNTQQWIAFLAKVSPKMDDAMYESEVEWAMHELVRINPYGMHLFIFKDEADKLIPLANAAYESMQSDEVV